MAAQTAEKIVFDRRKFLDTQQLLGKDKSAVAVQRFKNALGEHLANIAAAAADAAEKGQHAHKLVASAGSLGFQELSDTSKRLMQAAHAETADLKPYIDAVMSAADRASAALAALSAEVGPGVETKK